MSAVATAIVGAAVIGGVAADRSAKKSAKEARRGSNRAVDAQLEATRMQVDELARQFDYQMEILYPQIQQQYNAQGAFGDLMGITAANPAPRVPDYVATYEQESAQRQQEIGILNEYRQRDMDELAQLQQSVYDPRDPFSAGPRASRIAELERNIASWDEEIASINNRPYRRDEWLANEATRRPPEGRNDNFRPTRGPNGEFIDNNISQNRLADDSRYVDSVRNNLLAGEDPNADPYMERVNNNRLGDVGQQLVDRADNVRQLDTVRNNLLAGRTAYEDDALVARTRDQTIRGELGPMEDDALVNFAGENRNRLFDFATGTEIFGPEFTESPGYAFAREEMQRELDRQNSAGGNYGGRAIMEAQRRAAGLANQEYYNWARGRSQELARQDSAMRGDIQREFDATARFADRDFQSILADAQRGDAAAQRYLEEQASFDRADAARIDSASAMDINRGDQALNALVNYQASDIGRGDVAFQDWMRRREGDTTRLDDAARYQDSLAQYDMQRQDQAYYNYLNNLGVMAGFGGGAQSQAVQASQAYGSGVANAYGAQGAGVSSIYNNLGRTNAAIAQSRGENINNAFQSGVQNWITYRGTQTPQPAPTPTGTGG